MKIKNRELNPGLGECVQEFCQELQEKIDETKTVGYDVGKGFVYIYYKCHSLPKYKYALAFIDISNGDIYRGGSFKSRNPGVRGNIYDVEQRRGLITTSGHLMMKPQPGTKNYKPRELHTPNPNNWQVGEKLVVNTASWKSGNCDFRFFTLANINKTSKTLQLQPVTVDVTEVHNDPTQTESIVKPNFDEPVSDALVDAKWSHAQQEYVVYRAYGQSIVRQFEPEFEYRDKAYY